MSDTVSRAEFEKVLRQARQRKAELATLQQKMQELTSHIETLQTERDEAVTQANELAQAYETFTSENEMQAEIERLQAEIKTRDVYDALSGIEGIDYQDGVSLQDVLDAAGVNLADLDEIPDDFGQAVLSAAQQSKPYLFRIQAEALEPENKADVRQETVATPALKAFGAQAVGGGTAPAHAKPDPAKTVDWTNPAAVRAYQESNSNNK